MRRHRPAIVETAGDGWFEPCHPVPLGSTPSALWRVLEARQSMINIWSKMDYHARCGTARVLGRQMTLVNSPDGVKHVMATNHRNFERKSPQMRRALEKLLGDGLFISDGETWKQRRPLVSDIVHKNRVPTFGRTFEEATVEMVARWKRRPAGEAFPMQKEMAELTAEIISRAVFGNTLGSVAAHDVIEGFSSYQDRVDTVNFAYFLGADEGLPIFQGLRIRRAVARVQGIIDKVINDHLEGHGQDNSMVDLLVKRQQKSPGLKLDVSALRNEAATIFMAGHETTAAVLTWVWYLLANAPWVETALHSEIADVCGDRIPTVADVPKLDWCRAVIEETMRLYPPVPFLSRQVAEADIVGGVPVDKASLVIVSPWLLHRSPDLWAEPNRFMPERFLGEQRPTPYSYIPFAAGPRICPGLAFGLTEATLCLAILAQKFKVRVAPGHVVEPANRLTLRPKGNLPVVVESRA